EQSGALHRIGLDKRWPCCVPARQTTLALWIGLHHRLPELPGDFDVLGVRAYHPAVARGKLTQAEQEAVTDIEKAETLTFTAPIVHEDLKRRHAVIRDVGRDAGELLLGRDDKVITEVDP